MLSLAVVLANVMLSFLITGCLRQYCIRQGLLDLPNSRSSHVTAVPRGGGLSFVAVFLLAVAALALLGLEGIRPAIALTTGGGAIAFVGWVDDRRPLSPLIRITAHFLSAAWAVAWLGGVPPLTVRLLVWHWGVLGDVVAVVGIVWLVNLYNFMDGIDGIAGTEAVSVSLLSGVLFTAHSLGGGTTAAWWILAASVSGFLLWNWPPAKIFMGDTGSGFLGFIFGVLLLSEWRRGESLLWPPLILLGVFVTDGTVTLVRRFIQGQCVYQAHRSHAYQHAARRWGHLRVTAAVAAINFLCLAPLAWWALERPSLGFGVTVFTYVSLAVAATSLGAGREIEVQHPSTF